MTVASAKKQKMKRENQNKETALSEFLDNIQQDKFLALYGMLKSGFSPYSNRFLLYWKKQPPKNHSKNVAVVLKKKGMIPFDDAWKILTAYCYAVNDPTRWKDDIPAIVSHWLICREDVSGMLSSECERTWDKLLATLSRSNGSKYHVACPRNIFPLRSKKTEQFSFIDLFAGIGGFRIPLQEFGGKCVFSSEWEQKARETYYSNYGEWPFGDITNFTATNGVDKIPSYIPDHDILAAGFPCQPFSHAGQKLGFEDTRGTLFFDILQIAKHRRPKVLFLENVRGLKGHDKGHTFNVICNSLYEIGYKVYTKMLCAKDYGVPQNRHRIFIVAFRDPIQFKFPSKVPPSRAVKLHELLEKNPEDRYTITERMWKGHVERRKRNRENGKGFGYQIFEPKAPYVSTLSARYWKDGSEILINQSSKSTPRTLTPRECARLQGFPEQFVLHSSKKSSYQQFGNSVAVPVIRAITKEILHSLSENEPVIDSIDPLQPMHL